MELKVIVNPIDGAGPGKRLLSNLFHGCGYSFYRSESRLRLDDLLIRVKLGQLLRESRAHLRSLACPDPHGGATARALERAQCDLQAMETAIRAATVPEMHRLHRRNRQERGPLERLVTLDGEVLLALLTLRDAIARLHNDAVAATSVGHLLRASDFSALWSRREALLMGGSE